MRNLLARFFSRLLLLHRLARFFSQKKRVPRHLIRIVDRLETDLQYRTRFHNYILSRMTDTDPTSPQFEHLHQLLQQTERIHP